MSSPERPAGHDPATPPPDPAAQYRRGPRLMGKVWAVLIAGTALLLALVLLVKGTP